MGAGIAIHAQDKSGNLIPVEIALSVIYTDDDTYILCSMQDTTDLITTQSILKQSAEELELRVLERTHDLVIANEKISESEHRYAMLYEDAPDMYASLTPGNGIIEQCNLTLVETLGYSSKEDIIGKSVFDFYSASSQSLARECFNKFVSSGSVGNTELNLVKRDGSLLPVMLKVNAVRDDEGNILYSMSSWRDISILKALEQERKTSFEMDLIYKCNEIVTDEDIADEAMQKIAQVLFNAISCTVLCIYKFSSEQKSYELMAQPMVSALSGVDDARSLFANTIPEHGLDFTNKPNQQENYLIFSADNSSVLFTNDPTKHTKEIDSALVMPICIHSYAGYVFVFHTNDQQSVSTDVLATLNLVFQQIGRVLERKHVEKKYEELAHYDIVTGLPNRSYFHEVLERYLSSAKRHQQTLALLFLDLDNFKHINDTLGHFTGDELLRNIATLLQGIARTEDFVARLGGDEFIILTENVTSDSQSVELATKILEGISRPHSIDGHLINVTASIGIASYTNQSEGGAELLQRHADIAMYRAKDMGKNNFQFYSEELNEIYQRHVLLETQLRNAINDFSEFYLHYHPQISLTTGEVCGFEVLMRWHNHVLGEVSPAEFIPIAEDAGMIEAIGAWVFDTACQQFVSWCNDFPDALNDGLILAINVSMIQLVNSGFVKQIKNILKKYHLKPKHLMLEITETAIMTNLDNAIASLQALHHLGVGIAIDDFGTGYSSLSYLKQLPFTALKIDQAFVQDVTTDVNDVSIVKAIIQLGTILELDIIAEGVESKAQLEFLKASGCHYAQGYYFSRPLAKESITNMLIERYKPSGD